MKVTYTTQDGLGRMILSGPPQNKLTHPRFTGADELRAFLTDPCLRAVTVQGAGRHFCAGADLDVLAEQAQNPDVLARALAEGQELLEMLASGPVPVIAVIRGSCLGAGLEVALACHFRIASRNALLGFPESTHGMMPGFGGTVRGTEVLGHGRTIDLALSGKLISGQDAGELGLVDMAVETSGLNTAAEAFVAGLVGKRPPHLIHAVMQSIHNARRLPIDEALREEAALFLELARRTFSETPADPLP